MPVFSSTSSLSDTPEKVLIVQTAFIGDVVLATALVESVRHKWPDAAIDLVVIPKAANAVENNPNLRRVITFDKRRRHRRLYHLWKLARKLRAERYDLALAPHRSLRSALLVWLAGIPQRVGFNRSAAPWLFHHRVVYRQKHEVERNLDLLRPFGGGEEMPPKIYWTAEDDKIVDDWLNKKTRQPRHLIALAPGSVWPTKRWPQEYFEDLAWEISEHLGSLVVLIGGPEDAKLCERIRVAVGGACFSVAGELTLRQTAALLRRCDLLISNDSAPTHLGVAAGCRVMTIFGSTVPAFGFAPYDPNGERHVIIEHTLPCRPCTDHGRRHCPLGTLDCLKLITPERVFAKVSELLQRNIYAPSQIPSH
jgi:heptosyltransferase-2